MRLAAALLLSVLSSAACKPPAASSPAPAPDAEVALETEAQKTLYALGAINARSMRSLDLEPAEVEFVVVGLRDGLLGRQVRVSPDEYMPQLQALVRERNERTASQEQEAAQTFLEQAAKLPGAVRKESGLIYLEKAKGQGALPAASDQVKVHYRGTLRDGTEFDSSYKRNEPAVFPLTGVIPCWTEALQLMQVGGKAEIYCPSAIAYGDAGQGGLIRPGAALRFEVELLEIQ